MNELRIPVMPLEAEVLLRDGEKINGCIFLPTAASNHTGSMRPMEWLNLSTEFLPFLPNDASAAVILNKHQIAVLTVSAENDKGDLPDETPVPLRRVALEMKNITLEGVVSIEMPENKVRVLDLLNSTEKFMTLQDGDRHHLVRKEHVVRVREIEGA